MRYFIYCRKSSEGEERQVLSLASQQEALAKAFGASADIEIVGVYEEAKSAKTPGRPIFAEMLQRIEAGDADGIASWAPDRLARNSVDGGHIIYLLDRGVLRDLKFATYTFENNSQGKFMLGIMFNQSKYYSDALSENVKRGNATKVAMGWRPNQPPIGYLNCPVTRTIIPDPDLFPLVRRIFELFLSGTCSPPEICRIAKDEWGFLTPRKARSGDKPLGRSTIYRMLSNPFYMGALEWGGVVHAGRHPPVVTRQEFARVQTLMTNSARSHEPARRTFAFAGLLSCGACGHAICAEYKTNRHGSHYTYYHCAARGRISGGCRERSVEEDELTRQFTSFLASLAIRPKVAAWARERLYIQHANNMAVAQEIASSQATAKVEIATQLAELTSLRLRRMIEDDEFMRERRQLEATRQALETSPDTSRGSELFELWDLAERVSNQAVKWFATAPPGTKRRLLKIVCSNPILSGQKLSVQAKKPLVIRSDLEDSPNQRRVVDSSRTITREGRALLQRLKEVQALGQVDDLLTEFREAAALFVSPGQLPKVRSRRIREKRPLPPLPWKVAPRYRARKLR